MKQPQDIDDVTVLTTWGESETCVEAAQALDLEPRALERRLVDMRRLGLKIPVKPFGVLVEPPAPTEPDTASFSLKRVGIRGFAKAWQEGTSLDDIATRLGTSVVTVRAAAYRLRKRGLQLRDRRAGGNNRMTPERLAARAEEIAQVNAEMSEKGAPWTS